MIHTDGTPTYAMNDVTSTLNELAEVDEANMHRRLSGIGRVVVKRDLEAELRRDIREAHLIEALKHVRDQVDAKIERRDQIGRGDLRAIKATADAALLDYERAE